MSVRPAFLVSAVLLAVIITGAERHSILSANPAEDAPDRIIARYVQACGGEALGKTKTELWRGTLVRGASGRVPLEIMADSSGRWRYTQTFAWGDRIRFGCDGSAAWEQDGDGVHGMKAQQQSDISLLTDFNLPLRISRWFPDMTVVGSDSADGKEIIIVSAIRADNSNVEMAFERESGLLVKVGEICFSDYRAVGETNRPFKIILGSDSSEGHLPLVMELTEIEHDLEFDDSVFARPQCGLPPAEPPLHKPRTYVEVSVEALDACAGQYRSLIDTNLVLVFVRQDTHLMCGVAGRLGGKMEIRPESDTDYYVEFTGQEFHFVKDDSGQMIAVELGAKRNHRANKIK